MFLWSNENSLPFLMILSTQVSPTVAACPRYHRGPLPLLPFSPETNHSKQEMHCLTTVQRPLCGNGGWRKGFHW